MGLSAEATWQQAGTLSGGNQRKLCIALALLGDPYFLGEFQRERERSRPVGRGTDTRVCASYFAVLDEPTAGMDQVSRRRVWDLLRRKRPGRVTLLTSHSMDECEALGDRIAILRSGALACVGSALFLKQRFGVGYNLVLAAPISSHGAGASDSTISALPGRDSMLALVRQHVAAASFADGGVARAGETAHIVLPLSSTPSFPALLRGLDDVWKGEYSLAVTSMEDVFIAASAASSSRTAGAALPLKAGSDSVSDAGEVAAPFFANPDSHRLRGSRLMFAHCRAMLDKRLAMLRAAWSLALCTALVPAVFLVVATMLSSVSLQAQLATLVTQMPLLHIDAGPFPAAVPIFAFKAGSSLASAPLVAVAGALPPGTLLAGLTATTAAAASVAFPDQYGLVTSPDNVTQTLQLMASAILDVPSRAPPSAARVAVAFRGLGTLFPRQDPVATLPTSPVACYDAFVDPTIAHVVPAALNLVSNALFRVTAANGSTTPSTGFGLHVSSHPLTASDAAVARARAATVAGDVPFVVLALVAGLAIIPAVAAGTLGREIEVGAKRQQLRAGASPSAFWAAAALVDVLPAVPAAAAVLVVIAALGPDRTAFASTTAGRSAAAAGLVFLYAPAALGAAYIIASVTRGAQSASIVSLGLGVLGGVLAVAQSSLRGAPATCDVALRAAGTLRYLLPSFALGEGLIATATLDTLGPALAACGDAGGASAVAASALAPQAAGAPILALGLMAAVWIGVVYASDALPRRAVWRRCGAWARLQLQPSGAQAAPPLSAAAPEDPDVAAERARITAWVMSHGSAVAPGGVVLDSVRKEYGPGLASQAAALMTCQALGPPRVALDALSFGVAPGASFGLIGANGAGKSTAMGIASGDARPTAGSAFGGGIDVGLSDAADVATAVGFCPQHDPLVGALTAKEHLRLYARLAGLPDDCVINVAVARALRDFDLELHAHTPAAAMSGGTRRKLCAAAALIGRHRVILLDEPTAGVDIEARRGLWQAIAAAGSSGGGDARCPAPACVLTTHAVEEAEALCDRVGVLLAGRLQCIGSSLHLRARFGRTLRADIKLCHPLEADVDALVAAAAAAVGSSATGLVSTTTLPAVMAALSAEVSRRSGVWAPAAGDALVKLAAEQLGFAQSDGGVGGGSRTTSDWLGRTLLQPPPPPPVQLPIRDVAAWVAEFDVLQAALLVLAAALPGSEVLETHGLSLRLAVPAAPRGMEQQPGLGGAAVDTVQSSSSLAGHAGNVPQAASLAALFSAIEGVVAAARVESYTLGAASLETVVAEMLRAP